MSPGPKHMVHFNRAADDGSNERVLNVCHAPDGARFLPADSSKSGVF